MKIKATTYQNLLMKTPAVPPESGGILGGENDIISHFCADYGIRRKPAQYEPDIDYLNQIISQWRTRDIHFYGIYHSHYSQDNSLSPGDKKYIEGIMQAMPDFIHSLYFPIILPREEIIPYRASRANGEIEITCEKINII